VTIGIRPYRLGDAPPLFEAAVESVGDVFPWLPWCRPGYTLAESAAWVAHAVAAFESGTELNFVIHDGAGRFLGGCGLNQIVQHDRVANLGYWVRSSATGRGVAPAAVMLVAKHAFEETALVRLEIVVATDNVRSLRVAEKVGALREGIAHDRIFMHGRARDAVVFAILRSRTLYGPPASG
jgi:RimJ/RimL family protein N-acetyltransferase